jgi:hypothetical protein
VVDWLQTRSSPDALPGQYPSRTQGGQNRDKNDERPTDIDRVRPAVIAGVGLCLANYGIDFLMDRLATTASKTIVSDVAIGILGALAVDFLLSSRRERQDFESAKERIILIRELNRRIRARPSEWSRLRRCL